MRDPKRTQMAAVRWLEANGRASPVGVSVDTEQTASKRQTHQAVDVLMPSLHFRTSERGECAELPARNRSFAQ